MENLVSLNTGDGEILSVAGSSYRILLTGKQTQGAMAIIEMLIPPQSGPVPHEHKAFQENFYVLEGEVQVKTETQTYLATKGSLVNIPLNGPIHCFKNISTSNAKLLCIVAPAGLDEFFIEIAGLSLPATVPTAEVQNNMRKIAEKYGQKIYPPDYLD
jgi:quercetin dioxygenase-like cupin family protein